MLKRLGFSLVMTLGYFTVAVAQQPAGTTIPALPPTVQAAPEVMELPIAPPPENVQIADWIPVVAEDGGFWSWWPFELKKSHAVKVEELRSQVCKIERSGHGMPIWLDKGRLTELRALWGDQKVADFLRPIARTNFSHRCYCAGTAEKAKLGCQ